MSNLAWCYDEGSKNQMTADKRLEIKCDRPPRNESEVPSGCFGARAENGCLGCQVSILRLLQNNQQPNLSQIVFVQNISCTS